MVSTVSEARKYFIPLAVQENHSALTDPSSKDYIPEIDFTTIDYHSIKKAQ
jgi:hypothetical protein